MTRVGEFHVLTDETLQSRFSHAELARLAAQGGADTIQLREKRPWTESALRRVAWEIVRALEATPASLLVNDRVDLAAAVAASGVHLGRADIEPGAARKRLGPQKLIGRTANSIEELLEVNRLPVDYIGVGPVFGTRSKASPATPLGVDGLRRIAAAATHPVIAIGNILPQNVAELLEAGAHGIAVLSAVSCSADPLAAAARFREALDRCHTAAASGGPAS